MIFRLLSIFAGTALLVVGIGLLFAILGVRAELAQFAVPVTGLVMSAYFAGFILGTYFVPALIRRVGHIRAFAAMASIASTMPILHALAVDPWIWGALRLVTGVCIVGLYIVIESWLNALAPNEGRGRLFAAYMAVTLVAMAAGQALVAFGDKLGFVPFALVSVLLSFALVPITLTRVAEPAPIEAPRLGLRWLHATSPLGVAGAFASGLLSGAFLGMGAVFAQRVGFADSGIAAFTSWTILGGAALQWPIGHFSDRGDRRQMILWVCAAAAVLAALGFVLAGALRIALVPLGFVYGGLAFSLYGLSVAHVNDFLSPARVLEATGGLLLLHGIGAVVGPAAAGLLMEALGPGSLMLYFAAVLVALALFAAWRLRAPAGAPVAEGAGYVSMAGTSPAALRLHPRAETTEG